jgi:hypothetical protein
MSLGVCKALRPAKLVQCCPLRPAAISFPTDRESGVPVELGIRAPVARRLDGTIYSCKLTSWGVRRRLATRRGPHAVRHQITVQAANEALADQTRTLRSLKRIHIAATIHRAGRLRHHVPRPVLQRGLGPGRFRPGQPRCRSPPTRRCPWGGRTRRSAMSRRSQYKAESHRLRRTR